MSIEALDLSDLADIDAFAARIGDRPIDLLINNAGTMGELPLEDHIHKQRFGGIDYELWAEILTINTLGTVKLTELLTENVAASERRIIVMVSSTAGLDRRERPHRDGVHDEQGRAEQGVDDHRPHPRAA